MSKAKDREPSFILFAGSSHLGLARDVARFLRVDLGKMHLERFPDGEIGVEILENVRGKDVFVLQSAAKRPNHYLMELFVMVDALKRASARSVVAVLPYYPYARQDRKGRERKSITARLVADLLETAGVCRVVTMDLHTEQIQGFFKIPVDNLYGRLLLAGALRALKLKNGVIVSPDVGNNRLARKFAEDLKMDLAIVDKRRVSAEKIEVNTLIGDVKGKEVILVDDICSTGTTLGMAAEFCRKKGAKAIFAAVTHGIFVGDKLPKGIDQFFVTDTVDISSMKKEVRLVSIASHLATAIDCIASAKSLSSLF